MSDTQTPQQSNEQYSTPVVTQEIIKAKFNAELTKLKYQEALQNFLNWGVTQDNVSETQEKIKRVRAFIRKLGEIKDEGKRPSLMEGRMWDSAYKSFLTPLEDALSQKDKELQVIVNKIAEENRKKEQERLRVEGIKKEIDTFILNQSQTIAAATTDTELITIEKLIGSHKANKTRYQEFLEEFALRCNELTPLIKKQKDHIRELAELKRKEEEAEKKGDDKTVLEMREQQEIVQHSIDETKVTVQETAISQAIRPDVTETTPVLTNLKYRRQSWKWEVTDIALLFKKLPHLVELTPNEEKIKDLLNTKKGDGSLKDVEEVNLPGLRLYLDKIA